VVRAMERAKVTRAARILAVTILVPLLTTSRDGPYAMYARTVIYHLDVFGTDESGLTKPYSPTGLAQHVGPSVAQFLLSADHDRGSPQIEALRTHLPQIAELACAEHRELATAEIVLTERRGEDAVTSELRARATCAR
jgi:hypothetical protein